MSWILCNVLTDTMIILPAQSRSQVHVLPLSLVLINPMPARPATVSASTVVSIYCSADAAVWSGIAIGTGEGRCSRSLAEEECPKPKSKTAKTRHLVGGSVPFPSTQPSSRRHVCRRRLRQRPRRARRWVGQRDPSSPQLRRALAPAKAQTKRSTTRSSTSASLPAALR